MMAAFGVFLLFAVHIFLKRCITRAKHIKAPNILAMKAKHYGRSD